MRSSPKSGEPVANSGPAKDAAYTSIDRGSKARGLRRGTARRGNQALPFHSSLQSWRERSGHWSKPSNEALGSDEMWRVGQAPSELLYWNRLPWQSPRIPEMIRDAPSLDTGIYLKTSDTKVRPSVDSTRKPAADSEHTPQKSFYLKLREQARRLGLKPGSPRWRAYVLGTKARMEKQKRSRNPARHRGCNANVEG